MIGKPSGPTGSRGRSVAVKATETKGGNFLRLSGRVAGGAHRASEGSWSSWNSRSSWRSWRLQRWPALAPTHGRSKSPLGLTGLLLVPARTRRSAGGPMCYPVCSFRVGRYPPAAALLVRRQVVPVLNTTSASSTSASGAWRVRATTAGTRGGEAAGRRLGLTSGPLPRRRPILSSASRA